jgi:hypothetical protein
LPFPLSHPLIHRSRCNTIHIITNRPGWLAAIRALSSYRHTTINGNGTNSNGTAAMGGVWTVNEQLMRTCEYNNTIYNYTCTSLISHGHGTSGNGGMRPRIIIATPVNQPLQLASTIAYASTLSTSHPSSFSSSSPSSRVILEAGPTTTSWLYPSADEGAVESHNSHMVDTLLLSQYHGAISPRDIIHSSSIHTPTSPSSTGSTISATASGISRSMLSRYYHLHASYHNPQNPYWTYNLYVRRDRTK